MNKNEFISNMADILQRWEFNGCVSICKNGIPLFEGVNGWADYECQIRHTLNSQFLIASVTKQFTATCIMMLVEEGKIHLEDKLQVYLPEYSHSDKMTIRQMLNMMSGIPDMINDVIAEQLEKDSALEKMSDREQIVYEYNAVSRVFSLSEVLELVNDKALQFTPGDMIRYSNTNYSFLGFIIEKVSGKTLNDYMTERIFGPLGMEHTCCKPENATCPGYERTDDIIYLGYGRDTSGDGCIVSTVQDLSLWLNAVLRKQLLTKSSWDQILTMVPNTDKNYWLENYGFGWDKTGVWYQHNGGDMGYVTFVFLCFERGITVAICENMPSFPLDEPAGRVEFAIMECIDKFCV